MLGRVPGVTSALPWCKTGARRLDPTGSAAPSSTDEEAMSVRIRLARGGTKKRPVYRIVAINSQSARDGRFLEKLGLYNPLLPSDSPERVMLREERIRYWLDNGAKPSDRVARFLDGAGITSNTVRHRGTGKKAQELEAKRAAAAAEGASA
jgi:small subunit ribosomal protein S16